jgi:hypothetical protein
MTIVYTLFFIDQQYLQNDIVMEKLIQTLFLIIMKNKTTEIKNSTNQSKKKTVRQKNYIQQSCLHKH